MTDPRPRVPCPACGLPRAAGEACPHCGDAPASRAPGMAVPVGALLLAVAAFLALGVHMAVGG